MVKPVDRKILEDCLQRAGMSLEDMEAYLGSEVTAENKGRCWSLIMRLIKIRKHFPNAWVMRVI